MDELTRLTVENYHKLNNSQRRAFNVRINGEEHSGSSRNGVAQIHFPIDGQLMQVSELAFKLIINDGFVAGGGDDSSACTNWKWGLLTYPTYQSWLTRYPVGSQVNVDCTFGCQCVDYSSAFWRAQVNRNLVTGNGYAWGIWVNRSTNAGDDFQLIYSWNSIQPGDWVVWGNNGTGHIAMAMSCPNPSTSQILFRNQNAIGSGNGAPMTDNIYGPTLGSNTFQGAFRFKNWTHPSCGNIT